MGYCSASKDFAGRVQRMSEGTEPIRATSSSGKMNAKGDIIEGGVEEEEEEEPTSPTSSMIIDKHMAAVVLHKDQGNELFRQKDYRKALGQYHRALLYLRAMDDPDAKKKESDFGLALASQGSQSSAIPESRRPEIRTMGVATRVNMMNCFLNLAEQARKGDSAGTNETKTEITRLLERCVTEGKTAINLLDHFRGIGNPIEYNAAKAHWKLAQAYQEQEKFELAKEQFTKAGEHGQDARKALQELERVRKVYEKAEAQRLKAVFAGKLL
ncbi:unnamed protein product [Amoebophrya sp. A25]|nr:unnamed protein product [Amoebophrya sp. A25]|eukprot:GSA25T00019004001.1